VNKDFVERWLAQGNVLRFDACLRQRSRHGDKRFGAISDRDADSVILAINKDELVDLMFDTAYGQLYQSVETLSQQPGDWRDALRFIAKQNWQLYRRHVWMLHITPVRPVLGPHAALKYEAELRPLDNLGLGDVEMDAVLTLILTHVEGCARSQAARDRIQRDTGITEAEWWVNQAPFMEKIVDPTHFPVATRVGVSAGLEYQGASSPEHAFTFGIERILAGVSELIRTKNIESDD
jgi:hypothetical protein